ncbi:S-adenosylmethionine sensor upstream of mTORC1-like isoform X2 [Amphiura filiformis]|uniref:S-adenosylmethionine sensor upstream of mTORC1-like isoform X2 n=1 Tax=Amphiura filiformis TaxID=82378 RepID=UPI003B22867B
MTCCEIETFNMFSATCCFSYFCPCPRGAFLLETADGDFERIWVEHCEDEACLGEYAYAMQHLATEHWAAKHPDDRIKWCYHACKEYFFHGGLGKALDKDRRRKQHQLKKLEATQQIELLGEMCNNGREVVAHGNHCNGSHDIRDSILECITEPRNSNQYNTIFIPFSGPLRLLDVGSCFNPFLEYPEFLSVGIDISPAVQSVHKCDFLNLQLQQPLQVAPDTVDTYLRTLKSPVETLPQQCFHVVVFSLLLSYFPSPYQRWLCCQKAHQLLQLNGLLLIITPDSSHANRHVDMVKSWKKVIESLGFTRCRYVKDTHLHFMAFRKTTLEPPSVVSAEISPDMLYIPQDYNEDLEESVFLDDYPRSDDDDRRCSDLFSELPEYNDDGDGEEDGDDADENGEEGSERINGEDWEDFDALSYH